MSPAGVVLAGGRSARMGTPKAALEWHGSTLLRRTTGILGRVVGPVIVVRAAGQTLPALCPSVAIHDDRREGLGPLHALAVGLAAAADRAEVVFACSTDLPFLDPALVTRVLDALAGSDAAVPVAHGFPQPLAAAYRTALAPLAARLVADGVRRLGALLDACDVVRLPADPLPLVNVNTPDEYRQARARPAPEVLVAGRWVRAATLAGAAAAAGVTLGGGVTATVNGGDPIADREFPLVPADAVEFVGRARRARPANPTRVRRRT